jgi:hypothetical protein
MTRDGRAASPMRSFDPVRLGNAEADAWVAYYQRQHHETFDIDEAARLEIGWWRAHRELQHRDAYPDATGEDLVDALAALYGHVYAVPVESVREAARGRAEAMAVSDAWGAAGRDPHSPALDAEREALVRGYTALLAAVGR